MSKITMADGSKSKSRFPQNTIAFFIIFSEVSEKKKQLHDTKRL